MWAISAGSFKRSDLKIVCVPTLQNSTIQNFYPINIGPIIMKDRRPYDVGQMKVIDHDRNTAKPAFATGARSDYDYGKRR